MDERQCGDAAVVRCGGQRLARRPGDQPARFVAWVPARNVLAQRSETRLVDRTKSEPVVEGGAAGGGVAGRDVVGAEFLDRRFWLGVGEAERAAHDGLGEAVAGFGATGGAFEGGREGRR